MVSYGGRELDNFGSYQRGGHSGDYTRMTETVSSNIQKITQNVSQLQKFMKQIGTLQDSEKLRDQISNTTHYTNQLAKETNQSVKDLSHIPPFGSHSDQRQQRMQKERLREEFSNTLKNFQTVQRGIADKERESIARSRANSGLEPSSVIEEDQPSDDQFLEKGFSQTKQFLQMEEDVDFELIKEREEAVLKLERDIQDVNVIFKDLGMLVHEQGEVLDSIEANVESAHHQVESGVQQLSKASTYQSKARRKKCIILIIVLVILGIIGLIIGLTVNKS